MLERVATDALPEAQQRSVPALRATLDTFRGDPARALAWVEQQQPKNAEHARSLEGLRALALVRAERAEVLFHLAEAHRALGRVDDAVEEARAPFR